MSFTPIYPVVSLRIYKRLKLVLYERTQTTLLQPENVPGRLLLLPDQAVVGGDRVEEVDHDGVVGHHGDHPAGREGRAGAAEKADDEEGDAAHQLHASDDDPRVD